MLVAAIIKCWATLMLTGLDDILPTRMTAIEQAIHHPRFKNPRPGTISISVLN